MHLELEEVGEVTLGEGEARGEVLGEVGGLGDGGEESLVNNLLVRSLGGGEGSLGGILKMM